LTRGVWCLPIALAFLAGLAPDASAAPRHAGKAVRLARAQAKDDAKSGKTDDGKGEKGVEPEDVDLRYTNRDYSDSSLYADWFMPLCDYPWTRTYTFERFRRPEPMGTTLDFFCPPVTTHLYYPELYPRQRPAGGTLNVDW
jgi:hypothetical protein